MNIMNKAWTCFNGGVLWEWYTGFGEVPFKVTHYASNTLKHFAEYPTKYFANESTYLECKERERESLEIAHLHKRTDWCNETLNVSDVWGSKHMSMRHIYNVDAPPLSISLFPSLFQMANFQCL